MTTIANAYWRRLDLPGSDAARLIKTANGYELSGKAVFLDARGPSALSYRLDLSTGWSTREGRVTGFVGERTIDTHIIRTHSGWTLNGRHFGMAEVVDLDLGFTPATNMAQLKRTGLSIGDHADFDVAWLDTGAEEIISLPQKFKRVAEFDYDYRSPTHDFHVTLTVDQNGFAASYPGLWIAEYRPES